MKYKIKESPDSSNGVKACGARAQHKLKILEIFATEMRKLKHMARCSPEHGVDKVSKSALASSLGLGQQCFYL